MKHSFFTFDNKEIIIDLVKHDIDKYNHLFHVTLKDKQKKIEHEGLLINQLVWKSLAPTGFIHCSYPITMDTSDCFRWYDESCTLIVLNCQKLKEDGFIFYDDYWAAQDLSSKRNHIITNQNIAPKYIHKIINF